MSKESAAKTTSPHGNSGHFVPVPDHPPGLGLTLALGIAQGFVISREAVAKGLVWLRITPNVLTVMGFLVTCAAGWCLFVGGGFSHTELREAGRWPYMWLTGWFLVLSCAFDMLDGAVARLGRMSTPLGAVLDSSVDRYSDMIIFVALVGHFVMYRNLTYALLSAVALGNYQLISYVKARSENLIPECGVGYWQRGERCVALLCGAFGAAMPAMLWQQSITTGFTVLRRLSWTYQVLNAKAQGREPPKPDRLTGWMSWLRPWRSPRGTAQHAFICTVNIVSIFIAPHVCPYLTVHYDPLRACVAPLFGN